MANSQGHTNLIKLSRVLILILLVVLPIAGFYLGRSYERVQSKTIKQVNTPLQTSYKQNVEIVNTNQEDVPNTNKVQIKQIDLNGSWTNDGFLFSLKNVYLTPNIADIQRYKGYIHGYENYKESSFLAVEVSVRNVYTSGVDREINVKDNFSLKDKSGAQTLPLSIQYYSLSPQEDKSKVFVYFPLNKTEEQFSLYVGPTSRPRIIDLAFDGASSKILQGYWIYRDGYSPEYYNREPLFEYFK